MTARPGTSAKPVRLVGVARLLVAIGLVGLVASSAAAADAGFVYAIQQVSDGTQNQIWGFRLDSPSGTLTLLPGFPVATGGTGTLNTFSEALAYLNGRLYAVNQGSSTLSAFTVNRVTGALTAMPFSPIPLASGLWGCVAVHPSGSPVVVGGNSAGIEYLASFAVTATTATAAPGSPMTTGVARPFSCAFSRDGNYVYTGGNSGNFIAGFGMNASTGALTPLTGSPFDSGTGQPLAYATDASGRLFTSNLAAGQLRAFTTASGNPFAVTGNPFASGLLGGIHGVLHPSGLYLVADRVGNQVGVYRINGSGAATTLSAVAGSPFPSPSGLFTDALALSPDSALLVAANGNSRNLTVFQVNASTGSLTSPVAQAADTLGRTGLITGLAIVPTTPTVVTGTASAITLTSATLNGTANPNGSTTTASFQWGLTNTYGNTTQGQAVGAGNVAVAIGGGGIAGLACGTTYHFRATATNASGTTFGGDASFTTTACPPPTVVTLPATNVAAPSATLNGTANPNGYATTASFQWGLTNAYGNNTPGQGVGAGNVAVPFSQAITGLVCGTTYHFRATATNAGGTINGGDASFTPVCVPGAPTGVLAVAGNRQATVSFNPPANNGGAAITSYRVTASPGGATASGPSSPLTVTGLTNGTPYTFTVVATNSIGPGAASSPSNSVTPMMTVPVPNVVGLAAAAATTAIRAAGLVVGTVTNTPSATVPESVISQKPLPGEIQVKGSAVNIVVSSGLPPVVVFRPAIGGWFIRDSSQALAIATAKFFQWGLAGDVPIAADFDGDGKIELSVFRPPTGEWFLRYSTQDYAVDTPGVFQWGMLGDVPIASDFDGDGQSELAVYRPSIGGWFIRKSSEGYAIDTASFYQWGQPGDVPITADFDGDGKTELAVWRPSNGTWYIRYSSLNYDVSAAGVYQWGQHGDVPLAGDFDGDGKTDLAIFRPSIGGWFILKSSERYAIATASLFQWGQSGDVPVGADFDADGKTDLTIFRPATGEWFIRYSAQGYDAGTADVYRWGAPGDVPITR